MNFKFLMIICMAILLVGSVSAFEFDNVKSYDPITREVTITNAYGLGSEIGKARLNTPLNVRVGAGYQKVAELDLWAYDNYNDALKKFTFTDLKKKVEINRDFDLKYLTYKNIEINDYKNIQVGVSGNGTAIYEYQIVGSHFEEREVWNKITSTNLLKNERLTIGIFTEVKIGDYVDWIPTIYGIEVNEWASWTADLNVNLISYYKLDKGSGTVIDELGLNNGTNNGATRGVTGIINNSFDFDGSNDWVDRGALSSGEDQGAISVWIKRETNDTGDTFLTFNEDTFNSDSYMNFIAKSTGKIGMGSPTGGLALSFETDDIVVGDTNWHHIIIQSTGTYYEIWVDAVQKNFTMTVGSNNGDWNNQLPVYNHFSIGMIERAGQQYNPFNGLIDEVVIWERSLNQTEIILLYNGGHGLGLNSTSDDYPSITLNSPTIDTNYTTAQSLEINFTASDDQNLTDVKLYVNDILNQTNASGINNTNYIFDLSLSDGNYTIKGIATDNQSQTTNSSEIFIFIDTIHPTLEIITPITTEITTTLPYNVSINITTTDTNLNNCWYYTSDSPTNITYTCNNLTNATFNSGGSKTIFFYANDTLGNENSTSTTFLLNYIQESATYGTTIIETQNHSIILNITATEIISFNATFYYNGTEYTPTIVTTGNTSIITSTLTAPSITANDLVYFNWTYTINGIDYNSSNYNQTIMFLTPINITSESCVDKTLRFDIQDEVNLSALNGDVEYNFKYGLSNGSLKSVFGSLTNVTTFYLCINATVSQNYTLGYGEIQYRDSSYVDRRYYLFEGQIISNNTLTNHTLRDLLSVDQTSFLLTMEDTSLNVYSERYTALWRWYPNLDKYQIVEMGKTNDDGETVAHVETEDVDYRIGLYETDGTLIALDNPRRFVCTSSPCSLTIRVGAGDVDYSSVFDVQAQITYNETSGIFLVVYNDPNQLTSEMRFLVTRSSGTNTLIICNDTSSGFSGVMSCNTSAYTGLKKAVLYRSASPELPIAQKVVSEANTTFNSGFGLFISMMLWLAIVLSGFSGSPIPLLILSVVGLIPALLMGSINVAIFTGIAVLGAIIIHFIKRAVAK